MCIAPFFLPRITPVSDKQYNENIHKKQSKPKQLFSVYNILRKLRHNQLIYRDKLIPFFFQTIRKSECCFYCRLIFIMHQNDRTIFYLFLYSLYDLFRILYLPVQRVNRPVVS